MAETKGKGFTFAADLQRGTAVLTHEKTGVQYCFAWGSGCTAEAEGECLRVTFCGSDPLKAETESPVWVHPEKGDRNLYAFGAGVSVDAGEERELLPGRLELCAAHGSTMSFYGILRGKCGLLCAVETPWDAAFLIGRENGLLRTKTVWKPQKGAWGYPRVMRFQPVAGGITEICKAYRELAKARGLLVTLAEKALKNPNVSRFGGCANIWLWNDDAMEKLYDEGCLYSIPTSEMVDLRISRAKEMHDTGMTKVLWSLFDENTEKRECDAVKELGYIPTYYDIYTDVIPSEYAHLIPECRRRRCEMRLGCYPDGVVRDEEGNAADAWALKCTDGVFRAQKRICEAAAIECMERYAGTHSPSLGLEGRFLDVTYMDACECYDPKHPTTRRESVILKAEMNRRLQDMGLIRGTEVGTEDAAACVEYNEGMMSPVLYRAYDAGRRMTQLYEGENVPESIPGLMLNPEYRVPLWQLVFHDCMTSYWYWGDSHNSCPELMPLRDLFCLLYGEPPLFSFTVSGWEQLRHKITASYQKTVPFAEKTAGKEMLSFGYVNGDPFVQRTVFAGGSTVTVNFRTGESSIEEDSGCSFGIAKK